MGNAGWGNQYGRFQATESLIPGSVEILVAPERFPQRAMCLASKCGL